jgi:nucleoside-diphosphate-sugar epimerase
MPSVPPRYIVTGGAGFIGSNLVAELMRREPKAHVYVVDDFRTGSYANIVEACDRAGVGPFRGTVMPDDVGELNWQPAVEGLQPRAVFHLAAITDTLEFDEKKMMSVNTESFSDILDACAGSGVPLVYASSGATYGTPPESESRTPFPESAAQANPRHRRCRLSRFAPLRAPRGPGHDVICLDNFFTSQKSNVEHLLQRKNFELIRHDVTHPVWLEVDEIYNLACPAAPGHYQYNPIKTMKTSVMGAINVLGMAKRCRAKVLQASTSEVYGDPEVHPQPESYRGNVNPIGPRACYDEGKRAAETSSSTTTASNRVNIRVVRIFNTYGPACTPTTDASCPTSSARRWRNEDITIFGDGNQTRSFCYVDDLIEGLIRMMNGARRFTAR